MEERNEKNVVSVILIVTLVMTTVFAIAILVSALSKGHLKKTSIALQSIATSYEFLNTAQEIIPYLEDALDQLEIIRYDYI